MNNKLIKDYLSTLKCSELTKGSYKYDLKVFYNFCESIDKHFDELEIVDVETFFNESGKNKGERTLLRYKVSLNRFFKYLLKKEHVKKNIIENIFVEKKYDDEMLYKKNECEKLCEYFKNSDCLRDKIIFNLIFEYGVNPKEIADIKLVDFLPINQMLKLKNRTITLWKSEVLDIVDYLHKQDKVYMSPKSDFIFTGKYRTTFSRTSIYKSISKKAKELNIKVSPRDLRKYAIQKMLSWLSIEKVAQNIGIEVERVSAYKWGAK